MRSLLVLAALVVVGCSSGSPDATNPNNDVTTPPPPPPADVAPPAPPPPAATFDATDLAAFGHLKKAALTSKASSAEIWREVANNQAYEIDRMPMYFVRRSVSGKNERGYLVQHPAPKGTAVTSNPELLEHLGSIYRYDDQLQILGEENFSFGETIAGKDTFVFPYRPASGNAEQDEWDPSIPTSDEFFFLLVHEAFHRYQIVEGAWTDYPDWTQDEDKYPLTRETIALALLENAILSAGIKATEMKVKEKSLELFIAVRKARIAMPAMVVGNVNFVEKLELPQELSEGTANYAELHFRKQAKMFVGEGAAGGEGGAGVQKEIGDQLDRAKDVSAYMTSEDVRSELAFGRFYASGAAIGALLDAATPTTDWRSACKAATSPYQSAALRFPNVTGADADAKVISAKAAHGYDALLLIADKLLALPKAPPPPEQDEASGYGNGSGNGNGNQFGARSLTLRENIHAVHGKGPKALTMTLTMTTRRAARH